MKGLGDNNRAGLALENYVRMFKPKGWKESIGSVAPFNMVSDDDVEKFFQYYIHGSLRGHLSAHREFFYRMPTVGEAIVSFFESGLYKPHV
ncbi:MAG: hypothetical protein ABIH63_03940 [archaeon]